MPTTQPKMPHNLPGVPYDTAEFDAMRAAYRRGLTDAAAWRAAVEAVTGRSRTYGAYHFKLRSLLPDPGDTPRVAATRWDDVPRDLVQSLGRASYPIVKPTHVDRSRAYGELYGSPDWVSRSDVARCLGVDFSTVPRVAGIADVRCAVARSERGLERWFYARADVEALAATRGAPAPAGASPRAAAPDPKVYAAHVEAARILGHDPSWLTRVRDRLKIRTVRARIKNRDCLLYHREDIARAKAELAAGDATTAAPTAAAPTAAARPALALAPPAAPTTAPPAAADPARDVAWVTYGRRRGFLTDTAAMDLLTRLVLESRRG